jgi:hypothetical protein
MLNGNLSNVVTPRLVLVFEGALGFLPTAKVGEYNRLGSEGKWDQAARCWDLHALMMLKIWDVVWRQSVQIEVVTYAGPPEFAESLQERFDEEGLPISRTLSSTATRMARRLSYAPDIAYVYDADPKHAFTYGGKGRYLRSVHELGR